LSKVRFLEELFLTAVVHTIDEDVGILDVRIISARRATKQEIRCYEEED